MAMPAHVKIGKLTAGYVTATDGDVWEERIVDEEELATITMFCEKNGSAYRRAQDITYYMPVAYVQLVMAILRQDEIPYTADDLERLIESQTNVMAADEFLEHFALNWRRVEGVEGREQAERWLEMMVARLAELERMEQTLLAAWQGATVTGHYVTRRADGTYREMHAEV